MFKKLNKMKIGARLKKSFRQIILIFGILSALVVVIMLYTINNYGTILDNYAYPQGDIAMAMNESAEVRAASRGIVGYDSDSLIESMKEQHEQAVKSFEEYLEKIRPTMITKEGIACMDAITARSCPSPLRRNAAAKDRAPSERCGWRRSACLSGASVRGRRKRTQWTG